MGGGQRADEVSAQYFPHPDESSPDSHPDTGLAQLAGSSAVSYAFGTLVHVVAASHTKWNIVYDIANREVWFRSAASPTFKHISLNTFDLSCEAPPMMLDVNAALEGDVDESFTPHDHDINLKVFSTFCARYGIKVSPEGAANLMLLFESFECAP